MFAVLAVVIIAVCLHCQRRVDFVYNCANCRVTEGFICPRLKSCCSGQPGGVRGSASFAETRRSAQPWPALACPALRCPARAV